MKMLSQQRLDAYLIAEQLGNQVIKSLGLQTQIRKKLPAFLIKDLHVAFNRNSFKRHQAEIKPFWLQLENLRTDATY